MASGTRKGTNQALIVLNALIAIALIMFTREKNTTTTPRIEKRRTEQALIAPIVLIAVILIVIGSQRCSTLTLGIERQKINLAAIALITFVLFFLITKGYFDSPFTRQSHLGYQSQKLH